MTSRLATAGIVAVFAVSVATAGTEQQEKSRRTERRVIVVKQDGNNVSERREISLDENGEDVVALRRELQDARKMLEELRASQGRMTVSKHSENNGSRPFLGVILGEKTADGVMLDDVVEQSGAAKAGLQGGDVVTAIDGNRIGNAAQISEVIGTKKTGDHITVTFIRDGSVQTVEATLGKKSSQTEVVARFFDNEHHAETWTSAGKAMSKALEELKNIQWVGEEETGNPCERLRTLQNGALLGVYVNSGGKAVVQNTIENTGAVAAGLKSGDVITSLDGAMVGNYNDLRKAVTSHKPGERVLVTFIRKGESQTVSATLSSVADTRRELVAKLEAKCAEQPDAAPKKGETGELPGTATVLGISPNPSAGQVTIRLTNDAKEPAEITISDAEGRIVLTERMSAGVNELPLNLSELTRGVYFVNVKQGGREYNDKIVLN